MPLSRQTASPPSFEHSPSLAQAPPRPKLCWSATLTSLIYLCSAIPLSYQHSSAHWARPVAPRGCPLDIKPPEGLTTTLPPYVNSFLSIASPALPTGHNPNASYVINSFALKQSCNSTTYTSFGDKPAYWYTASAAALDISPPTSAIDDFSKVDLKSVLRLIPLISTA